jgi:hypothetical protein
MAMSVITRRCEQSAANPTAPNVGVDHQSRDNSELLRCQAARRASNQHSRIADASMEGDVPDNDVVAGFGDPGSQFG